MRAYQCEDVAGGRLQLQRLGQIGVAMLHVAHQLGVGDGVAGLHGEGLEQLDILVGERIDATLEHGDTQRWPVGRERRVGSRCEPDLASGGGGDLELRIRHRRLVIESQHDPLTEDLGERRRVSERPQARPRSSERVRSPGPVRVRADLVALDQEDRGPVRPAHFRGVQGDLLEEVGELCPGVGHCTQHAGERGLASEGVRQLRFQIIRHGLSRHPAPRTDPTSFHHGQP